MSDPTPLHPFRRHLLPLLLILWLGAFIPSARALLKYEWTAGAMRPAPLRWTSTQSPHTAGGRASGGVPANEEGLLIVAVHPLCSCTRATLEELENSAARWQQPYRATILLYTPKEHEGGPARPMNVATTRAAYIQSAVNALHAELVPDFDGEQAARLGALTSGEVLYYSAANPRGQRRLLFSGGVTAGRGMVGENGSIEALEKAVKATSMQAQEGSQAHSPVYGCGLAALTNQDPGSSIPGLHRGSDRSPAR